MKKAKLINFLLASLLALSLKGYAQEIRDPNEASKRFEAAISLRNRHGFSGRIWRNYPILVGQVNGSVNKGSFGLESWVWGGYDPRKKSGELDIGAKLTKQIFKYLELGLEGAIYSIKVGEKGENYKDIKATARVPIAGNLGASASIDLRNFENYALSSSLGVPINKNTSYKCRLNFWDSYNFGKSIEIANILDIKGWYINLKIMKAFENLEGETGKHKIETIVEVGYRYQLK